LRVETSLFGLCREPSSCLSARKEDHIAESGLKGEAQRDKPRGKADTSHADGSTWPRTHEAEPRWSEQMGLGARKEVDAGRCQPRENDFKTFEIANKMRQI